MSKLIDEAKEALAPQPLRGPFPQRSPRPPWIAYATVLWLMVGVVFLQWHAGAWRAELGGHPDEAAHYVTTLMARDYLAAGLPGNPIRFAQSYYEHYPKVALGHYPPLLYFAGAAWMLCFSTGKISMLVFLAFVTVLLGGSLWWSLRQQWGEWPALAGATLLIVAPLMEQHYLLIMADALVALLTFWALLCWIDYLEKERPLAAITFGVLASMVILTKTSGLWLAPVPLVSVLLTRQWSLLRRVAFWLPAAIVALLCAPWTLFTYKLMAAGMAETKNAHYLATALGYFGRGAWHMLGGLLLGLAVCGWAARIAIPYGRGERVTPVWAVMFALPICLFIFHLLVPVGLEDRYLLPALAPLLFAAMGGIEAIAAWCQNLAVTSRWPSPLVRGVLTALALLIYVPRAVSAEEKFSGFGAAAAQFCTHPANEPVLISSDAEGEGAFIAEVASRDIPRPGHTVLRSSKLLASSDWMGGGYAPAFRTEAELLAGLRAAGVRLVAVENNVPPPTKVFHHELLAQTIAGTPAAWRLLWSGSIFRPGSTSGGDSISLYELIGR